MENYALLVADLALLCFGLALCSFAAEWLARNPQARLTRWLDRQFRRWGA